MSRHIKGILAMPSFSPDIGELVERTAVEPITPECSEYEVRYRQGREVVYNRLLQLSKRSDATYDSSFLITFSSEFKCPEMSIETPVTTMMYYAGIHFAIGQISDYMNNIGD